jgi:hypothetical protein
MEKQMSQRQYAKYLGISQAAISKAIQIGKITSGWDEKTQKIIVDEADNEWGFMHLGKQDPKLEIVNGRYPDDDNINFPEAYKLSNHFNTGSEAIQDRECLSIIPVVESKYDAIKKTLCGIKVALNAGNEYDAMSCLEEFAILLLIAQDSDTALL